jgi:predicted Zn-dependent peptidase
MKTDDFANYMNSWYGFKNVVFVVAGDTDVVSDPKLPEHLNTLISKGGADRISNEQKPYLSAVYGTERTKIVFKQTEQSHFLMGFPSFARDDERRSALSVLTTLFGGAMSSRLFTEIREKRGLCYYVRAANDHYHDVGIFTGSAGVDPRRVNEAIQAMKQEFFALVDGSKPITQTEVDDAKENIIGQTFLDLEDSQSVASWYGMKQLLRGEVETEEQVIERIKAVTLEQVQQVAKDIVQADKLYFSLIGAHKQEEITW